MNKNCAVSYVRTCHRDKEKIARQQELIDDYAHMSGSIIVRRFEEAGSGLTTDRAELRSLIDFLENSPLKIDTVYIYSLNRLSRDFGHLHQLLGYIFTKVDRLVITAEGKEFNSIESIYKDKLLTFTVDQ